MPIGSTIRYIEHHPAGDRTLDTILRDASKRVEAVLSKHPSQEKVCHAIRELWNYYYYVLGEPLSEEET